MSPKPLCHALCLSIAALSLVACQPGVQRHPAQQPVPVDSNAELMEYIGDQPFITAEPACRALHILWTGEVFEGDYAALLGKLEEAGIVSPGWKHPPDALIDRATLGYMVARTSDIRSGLNWRLWGLGRYAYRELVYREIAVSKGEHSYVSGGEFLGILNRAEQYVKERDKRPIERVELGEEPGHGG